MKEELNEDKKKPKIGARSELFLPYVCPNMSVCTQPYFSTSTRDEGFTMIRWFPTNAKPLSGIRTKCVVRIQVERRFSFASWFALSLLNCGLPEMEGKLDYIYFQFNGSHLTKWAGINHLHPLCAFERMVYSTLWITCIWNIMWHEESWPWGVVPCSRLHDLALFHALVTQVTSTISQELQIEQLNLNFEHLKFVL